MTAEQSHDMPDLDEQQVQAGLAMVQQEINRIVRCMPIGQVTPTAPEWNALHARRQKLHARLAELSRDRVRAEQEAEQERRKAWLDREDLRQRQLPVRQHRNGWELATDGARWYVRDPVTKEIVYSGRLHRCRQVADESPPDQSGVDGHE